MNRVFHLAVLGWLAMGAALLAEEPSKPADEVLAGLRKFFVATARADGSFQPGVDPEYAGMSDSAHSDIAAVTYACTLHKTFGWKLPHEEQTIAWLHSRQKESGEFVNVAGTVDPTSAEGKTYNTTQGLVALHALGQKPKHDPLPIFEDILKADYKTLPAYSTSFFPLAYLCAGKPIPAKADRGIRELMVQDDDGYLNNHIAATFHASHYYALVGEPTPKSRQMVERALRDQRPDGSWLANMPSRDRHATFDAVFTLLHEGTGRDDCKAAIDKAAKWALSCQNDDGGFGHYPGSTSDADANYFQIGTLVMAGYLKMVDPRPRDPDLLSWGHAMPTKSRSGAERSIVEVQGWVGGVALDEKSKRIATAQSDGVAAVYEIGQSKPIAVLKGHRDIVSSVAFGTGNTLVTGSYDKTAAVWNLEDLSKPQSILRGHQGAVLSVAMSPEWEGIATGSIDGTIRIWNAKTGEPEGVLRGHKSWVNSVKFAQDQFLVSGSSDGTVKVWSIATAQCLQTIPASKAEVRTVAVSPDGKYIAAGMRYGTIRVWRVSDWKELWSVEKLAGDVWALEFAPDGSLVSGNGDWNKPGKVSVWNATDGKLIRSYEHTGEVLSIAVGKKTIVAGGGDKAISLRPSRSAR